MYHLQTEVEQGRKETVVKNKRGLMSSHAAGASRVIRAVLAGIDLDENNEYKADGYVFSGHQELLTLGCRKNTSFIKRAVFRSKGWFRRKFFWGDA